jgi:hypothetical protein
MAKPDPSIYVLERCAAGNDPPLIGLTLRSTGAIEVYPKQKKHTGFFRHMRYRVTRSSHDMPELERHWLSMVVRGRWYRPRPSDVALCARIVNFLPRISLYSCSAFILTFYWRVMRSDSNYSCAIKYIATCGIDTWATAQFDLP